ncbi:MAG: PIN domain-containing protein [Gemmataceae bacterium]|nr:PIN domain-containing protein [Gemmataceae bacterium]
MTLIDAGPLIALCDARSPAHARCVGAIAGIAVGSLATSLACVTEAHYMLQKLAGFPGQDALNTLIRVGIVRVIDLLPDEYDRVGELMAQYRDLPMDFADATIVALAERLRTASIVSLDKHFRIYRPKHCPAFIVTP